MVATVVTLAALAVAGAGVSLRLSDGSGDSAAVRTAPAWTVNVFTALGLIGSAEPSVGDSDAEFGAEAICAGFEAVWSLSLASLPSLAIAFAVSQPSTIGGAVRLTAATLTLFSIKLTTRASRALAVRPPNTTATIWRLP